jgi:hypothetical protein
MARGEIITPEDIMPRHLRMSGEMPAISMASGSSLADARKQLVLRTFATASGDVARTAKIVGISADEIRAEISAMLRSNGTSHAESEKPVAVADKPRPKPAPAASPAKSKARKR